MHRATTYVEALRALYNKRSGLSNDKTADYGIDNDVPIMARNAANTEDVELLRLDADGQVCVGGVAQALNTHAISFNLATNGSQASQFFFIVPQAYAGAKVVGIREVHATADGVAKTAQIVKCADGAAIASGRSLMTNSFDLNGAADTVQSATVTTATEADGTPIAQLAYKDRIGIRLSGAAAALAGLCITLVLDRGGKGEVATYCMNANGDIADQAFFVAPAHFEVSEILYAHTVAGTNAGAVNVQVTLDTGLNAPGAGTDVLTNNTAAGFNCKGAANTVQVGTFAATPVRSGSRLSVDFAGVLADLAGVVLVVVFKPTSGTKLATYNLAKNANIVDEAFFVADRSYQIIGGAWVHATAAGAPANVQVTVDTATDAPGAGTNTVSNNTNAGFDANGVANTVQFASFITGFNFLQAGDRVSLDYTAVGATAGAVCTLALQPY